MPQTIPSSSRPGSSRLLPVVAVIVANVALAFGPWFVRLADVGPIASGFWRLALAAPVLLAAAALLGQRPVAQARGLWGLLLLGGLAFSADLAAWHMGILRTGLANATLFGNAASLIFPIYGFLIARAWPTRAQGLALLLAGAGAGLLMGRSAELSAANLVGDLLCLTAGVLYAVYFITMARARTTMTALGALAWSTIAGAVPLLAVALLLGERVMPADWGPLLGLAVVSQLIGQVAMIYAIGHLSPLVIGIALLIQPVVGASVGWIVYDERLGLFDLTGAVMVAIALVLVRKGPPPALAPDAEDAQKA